jgi:hypothetical protein
VTVTGNVGGSRLVATLTDPDGNVLGLVQDYGNVLGLVQDYGNALGLVQD